MDPIKEEVEIKEVKEIKAVKKQSKWVAHVKQHRIDNPEKSYKQCLVDAKKNYVK